MRRRTINAERSRQQREAAEKPMVNIPGHWKQRVKLARDLGACVSTDAEARAFLEAL